MKFYLILCILAILVLSSAYGDDYSVQDYYGDGDRMSAKLQSILSSSEGADYSKDDFLFGAPAIDDLDDLDYNPDDAESSMDDLDATTLALLIFGSGGLTLMLVWNVVKFLNSKKEIPPLPSCTSKPKSPYLLDPVLSSVHVITGAAHFQQFKKSAKY